MKKRRQMKAQMIPNILNSSSEDQKPRLVNKQETVVIIDSVPTEQQKREQREKEKEQQLLQKRKEEQQEVKALQQQFRNFSHLPKSILRNIKADVTRYQNQNREGKVYMEFNRYLLRRKLIKISLIGAAELVLNKVVPINRIEQVLMKPESDKLGLVTIHVHNIQQYLFSQLYDPEIKKPTEELYQMRINLLICHLYNVVNFKFRRNFLNKTMTVDFITKATAEQLTTDEVKQRDLSQMKMILHQSLDLEQFLRTTYQKEQEQSQKPQPIEKEEGEETFLVELEREKETFMEKDKQMKKKIESSKRNMKRSLERVEGEEGTRLRANFQAVVLGDVK